MDQTENQKQQSLNQFIKSQFHKKLPKLLLSVSVFSLLFSHSYWISLLHSFNFNYHNSLPFQLFSHTIDKNCIFLFCNGLLVFLAKYSGLISSSSKYNPSDDESFKSYEYVPPYESIVLEPKAPLLENEVALESTAEALKNSIVMEGREEEELAAAKRETENLTLEEEEEDGEKWGLMTSEEEEENSGFGEEDEGEVKGYDGFFADDFEESENYDTEEEEEVEGNRVLSTEELNKRFDEFIRKMKEELRIEARQQLVMV